jgi:hypothetical protein
VYGTLILGRQSLAKAFSTIDGNGAFPHVVPGPITDRLRRFVPLGWYWLGAYGIFRQASIMRIESSSVLGGDISSTYSYTANNPTAGTTATTYTQSVNPAVDLGESGSPLA